MQRLGGPWCKCQKKRSGSSIVMWENMVYVTPALLLLTLSQEEGKSAHALKARAVISSNTCLCPSLSYPGNTSWAETKALLSYRGAEQLPPSPLSDATGNPRTLRSLFNPGLIIDEPNPVHFTSKRPALSARQQNLPDEGSGKGLGVNCLRRTVGQSNTRETDTEERWDCPELRDPQADTET